VASVAAIFGRRHTVFIFRELAFNPQSATC
jgi:hypothetical protein